jgi:hypothetical protein
VSVYGTVQDISVDEFRRVTEVNFLGSGSTRPSPTLSCRSSARGRSSPTGPTTAPTSSTPRPRAAGAIVRPGELLLAGRSGPSR